MLERTFCESGPSVRADPLLELTLGGVQVDTGYTVKRLLNDNPHNHLNDSENSHARSGALYNSAPAPNTRELLAHYTPPPPHKQH